MTVRRRPCAVCGRACRSLTGLCAACEPEILLLTHLYRAIAKERQALLADCPEGHPFDAANTHVWIDRKRRRVLRLCRACNAAFRNRRRKLALVRSLLAGVAA